MRALVAIAIAGVAALSGAAWADEHTECDALQKGFSERLAAAEIAQNDARALQAWSDAQKHCEAGNMQEAKAVLERATTAIGLPAVAEDGSTASPAAGSQTTTPQ
jgi:hypothetical protein